MERKIVNDFIAWSIIRRCRFSRFIALRNSVRFTNPIIPVFTLTPAYVAWATYDMRMLAVDIVAPEGTLHLGIESTARAYTFLVNGVPL